MAKAMKCSTMNSQWTDAVDFQGPWFSLVWCLLSNGYGFCQDRWCASRWSFLMSLIGVLYDLTHFGLSGWTLPLMKSDSCFVAGGACYQFGCCRKGLSYTLWVKDHYTLYCLNLIFYFNKKKCCCFLLPGVIKYIIYSVLEYWGTSNFVFY